MNEKDRQAFEQAEKNMNCDKFSAGWQAALAYRDAQSALAEPAGWRVAFTSAPRGTFQEGKPDAQTVEYWKSRGIELEYCYATPQPMPVQQEPVHFRAVICKEQQEQALGVVPKIVGFVDKKAAEQFILEKRDFQGWRYNLEPLYTEAPAVAQPPADVVRELREALLEADTAFNEIAWKRKLGENVTRFEADLEQMALQAAAKTRAVLAKHGGES